MEGYSGLISDNCIIPPRYMSANDKATYYNKKKAYGLLDIPYPNRIITMEKYIDEWIWDIEMNLI